MILSEEKRTQLLSKSKVGRKERDGKNRFQKRVKSKVKSNVSNLNKVDFNELFKQNILTVMLDVIGETNTYTVTISFGGFLDRLHDELKRNNAEVVSLKLIIKSLLNTFNSDDVYVRCSCPDFKYRHAYFLTLHNAIVGQKETRPSNITNPRDDLGRGCKHIMAVISNTNWIVKLASVIYNYVNYMEKHYKKLYADIIYPALYEKKYEEPVQLDIETVDKDELDTSADFVAQSNIYARDKNKFKIGNKQGIRFAKKDDGTRNLSIRDIEDEEETIEEE